MSIPKRIEAFARAFLDFAKKEPDTDTKWTGNVEVCCGNRETQLVLADAMTKVTLEMDQQASAHTFAKLLNGVQDDYQMPGVLGETVIQQTRNKP